MEEATLTNPKQVAGVSSPHAPSPRPEMAWMTLGARIPSYHGAPGLGFSSLQLCLHTCPRAGQKPERSAKGI